MNREEAFAALDRIAKGVAEMFGRPPPPHPVYL